jgi:hypothetical protein
LGRSKISATLKVTRSFGTINMPIDLTSKKAQKRARKHAEESAKVAEIYNRLLKKGNTNIWLDPKVEAATHILPPPENLYKSWEEVAPAKAEEQLAKEQVERNLIGWPWRGDKKRPTTLVRSNSLASAPREY